MNEVFLDFEGVPYVKVVPKRSPLAFSVYRMQGHDLIELDPDAATDVAFNASVISKERAMGLAGIKDDALVSATKDRSRVMVLDARLGEPLVRVDGEWMIGTFSTDDLKDHFFPVYGLEARRLADEGAKALELGGLEVA